MLLNELYILKKHYDIWSNETKIKRCVTKTNVTEQYTIKVIENGGGNQEWQFQRHWQHWTLKTHHEDKQSTTHEPKKMNNTYPTKNLG